MFEFGPLQSYCSGRVCAIFAEDPRENAKFTPTVRDLAILSTRAGISLKSFLSLVTHVLFFVSRVRRPFETPSTVSQGYTSLVPRPSIYENGTRIR